ncbi:MAG: RNA polymerase sigma factor [Planctomycetota bacterium]|nr:RNA polymerase sigma factor [Planctomycetota bacterium]MDA1113387.1 RNA polymerase sigma factor [Planctomycetota bacterium]
MTFAPLKTEQLESIASRLKAFAADFSHERLLEFSERLGALNTRERDRLSTDLMACYAVHESNEAFSLLYELNQEGVLGLIYHHLRRSFFSVDAQDILQEVFFNIYRYPKNFDSTKPSAFRNWTHSIVRNTTLKYSRKAQRNHVLSLTGPYRDGESDMPNLEPEDVDGRTPLQESQARETNEELVGAWMLYLHFYQEAYRCLTPREKRALYLVEVDEMPYKDAAAKLDVRVENLKMRIFRARRKIFTIMKYKFAAGEAASDCGPVRHSRAQSADAGRAPAADGRMHASAPAVEKLTSVRKTCFTSLKPKEEAELEGGA